MIQYLKKIDTISSRYATKRNNVPLGFLVFLLSAIISGLPAVADNSEAASKPVLSPAQLLFSGSLGEQWKELSYNGGDFKTFAAFENEVLVVDVPKNNNWGDTGIRSLTPLIKVPEKGSRFESKITLFFDPLRSSDFILALIPPNWDGIKEWRSHHIRVGMFTEEQGGSSLTLWFAKSEKMKVSLEPQSIDQISIVLRSDRLVLVIDGKGTILLQEFLPDNMKVSEKGYLVSVLAKAPKKNMGAKMALRTISMEQQPYEPKDPSSNPDLWLGESQKVVLFGGRILDKHWVKYAAGGGDFKKHALLTGGALIVDTPKDPKKGRVGIKSNDPLVWLDKFGEGAKVSVVFSFVPAQTSGFVVALTSGGGHGNNLPPRPNAKLHWRKVQEGGAKITFYLNNDVIHETDTQAHAPEQVSFILTPNGIQVDAPGIPDTVTPWELLAPSQSFRIFAYAQPDKLTEPAQMALKQILLERKAGKEILIPKPADGVAPLPVTVLFDGSLGNLWQTTTSGTGKEFSTHGQFENGRLTISTSASGYHKRFRLESIQPILHFNERIESTSYKLTLKLDPEQTTGFDVKFSHTLISFVRHTKGPYAGKYALSLLVGTPQNTSWRAIDASWVEENWDGRLEIENGHEWTAVHLPNGPSVRAPNGYIAKRNRSVSMAIYPSPEDFMGREKATMVLEKITGKWLPIDGMTALQRWRYIELEDFDPDAFKQDMAFALPFPDAPLDWRIEE